VVEIKDLRVNFTTYEGVMKVLAGVDLSITKGEMLGLVGETGCGKTMTGRAIMRILPPNAHVLSGEIIFEDGIDLLTLPEADMRSIRGRKISMIFQEPQRSLHPTKNVGDQISEMFSLHMKKDILNLALKRIEETLDSGSGGSSIWLNMARNIYTSKLRRGDSLSSRIAEKTPFLRGKMKKILDEVLTEKSVEMLKKVQIPDPERICNQYAHELSGGMMQRVLIAMALACNPTLLIADEPTTAVDVTTQAKILDLVFNLKQALGGSILLITHNLAVVAETCDRVCVMYAGTIVENADTISLFKKPMHPYTQGLLAAIPIIGRIRELKSIPGTVPNFLYPPSGCRFHPRCRLAQGICAKEKPIIREVEEGRYIACHMI